MDVETKYDSFLDAIREQQIALAKLGLPVHHLYAYASREVNGREWRRVRAYTAEGQETVFDLLTSTLASLPEIVFRIIPPFRANRTHGQATHRPTTRSTIHRPSR